ncbi:hypothetical protein E4U14_004219 [Claviceps sp. LM454 group G7]|nr:hypothetical protein E4U14_004219 [Claviceps sp. LM454 group G7]
MAAVLPSRSGGDIRDSGPIRCRPRREQNEPSKSQDSRPQGFIKSQNLSGILERGFRHKSPQRHGSGDL